MAITETTYKFEKLGWGSLVLEIADTNRSFYQPNNIDKIPFSTRGLDFSEAEAKPFFLYEWQKIQYSYIIDNNSEFRPPFEIRVNNRKLKESKERGNSHLLTGQFSFDDQVGETKIELRDYSNKLIFELCTEVFPQKMDYKSDYKAMMADISEIIQNLAYDTLKDTFRRSKARLSGRSTENEWWNILDALFDQLIMNLIVIKKQPKHEIRTSERVQSVEKIKNSSQKNINWFRKNTHFSNSIGVGVKVTNDNYYTQALSTRKYITYDTYENRFIAWAIKNIIEQLRQYGKRIESNSKKGEYLPLSNKIKTYQSRLQSFLHGNPFNEVGEFEKRTHFSTSLTQGVGYRDFMHVYLLLTRGLELADNEIFKIEQKNISTLYEYWCFLALVKIAKEQMKLDVTFNDLIKIKASKIKVELQKGRTSEIRFSNKEQDEELCIYFNREFYKDGKKIFTYKQVPDIILKFKKKGFQKPFWYVFDAKYRFEEKKEEYISSENQMYNVPQDAIGQLHRYRDAILHTAPTNSTYRGAIKNLGGIILYPYPKTEKEFVENTFFKSIEHVNIGALPFLPSKSGLVGDLLNKMINKTLPEEHFERFIEMDNVEYLEKRDAWKELVTIGGVQYKNQNERIRFISDKLIYHIPYVKNLNSKIYLSKNILVCKAGSKNAKLYKVKSWEILTNKELQILGTNWQHKHNKYIAFHLLVGEELRTPEKLSPLKFRYSTLEGLLRYIKNPISDKGYFYMNSPDSVRLYEELRKLNIAFTVKWVNNDENPFLIKFIGDAFEIYSSDKFPDLHYGFERETISLNSLLSKINQVSNLK